MKLGKEVIPLYLLAIERMCIKDKSKITKNAV